MESVTLVPSGYLELNPDSTRCSSILQLHHSATRGSPQRSPWGGRVPLEEGLVGSATLLLTLSKVLSAVVACSLVYEVSGQATSLSPQRRQ